MVYISYSRQNGGAAFRLSDQLEAHGVKAWLDVRELASGGDWREKVAGAIRSADAVLFLIGPPGCEDSWQRFEWEQVVEEEYYLDPSKPLIPVVIGRAELPGFLKARQAVQVEETTMDFAAMAEQVKRLLEKPEQTVNQEQLERGRAARQKAEESLREYTRQLEERNVKQAGLRSLK